MQNWKLWIDSRGIFCSILKFEIQIEKIRRSGICVQIWKKKSPLEKKSLRYLISDERSHPAKEERRSSWERQQWPWVESGDNGNGPTGSWLAMVVVVKNSILFSIRCWCKRICGKEEKMRQWRKRICVRLMEHKVHMKKRRERERRLKVYVSRSYFMFFNKRKKINHHD